MKKSISTIAIITGTGFDKLPFLTNIKNITVKTPYGIARACEGRFKNKKIIFLRRHGSGHIIPPHKINYKANIYALKQKKADLIIATAVVGSISTKIKPGDFAILDDFIDMTRSRSQTFFENNRVFHAEMTQPYDHDLNRLLIRSIRKITKKPPVRTVYVATEGPRFETRAEIRMFKMLGADVVGMTNAPEVVLAKEAEIPYAVIALSTNYACGISKGPVIEKGIFKIAKEKNTELSRILEDVLNNL